MRLVASGRAARRVGRIGTHISRDSPAAARRVEQALREAFDALASQPGLGRPFGRNVRRYVVPRLPYLVFYRPDDLLDEVLILTVRHARQRPIAG